MLLAHPASMVRWRAIPQRSPNVITKHELGSGIHADRRIVCDWFGGWRTIRVDVLCGRRNRQPVLPSALGTRGVFGPRAMVRDRADGVLRGPSGSCFRHRIVLAWKY